jgi:glycosyltransferase involved in cell wall biosynthesis
MPSSKALYSNNSLFVLSNKMNIAVITSSYPRYPGDGVGTFIHSLLAAISNLGHQVDILTPYDPKSSRQWLSQWRVRPILFIWPKRWSLLGHARSLTGDLHLKWYSYPLVCLFVFFSFFHLRRLVIRNKSEVIFAQWLIPGGLIGALVSRITKIPLVISFHGSDIYVAERYFFLKPILKFIFKSTCRATACSRDLAERVVKLGLPPSKVTVIPYGVDTKRFQPNASGAQKAKEKLSLKETRPIIIAMGRLVHKKGFSYFIKSIPHVLISKPNSLFLIAGEGDLRFDLEELADSLYIKKNFRMLGHLPWQDTQDYLALADIVVVPSIIDDAGNVDGLPNVVLEALSTGCALVASEVAGIPEVITHNRNGLLVPPRDEHALSKAIIFLLDDPGKRNELGTSARLTAENYLDWKKISERILAVLEQCLRTTN